MAMDERQNVMMTFLSSVNATFLLIFFIVKLCEKITFVSVQWRILLVALSKRIHCENFPLIVQSIFSDYFSHKLFSIYTITVCKSIKNDFIAFYSH